MRSASRISREAGWLLREKYGGVESPAFLRDVGRLKRGEPVDYVIGFREFLSCVIDLSRKPLIPRPETEYWAEKAIEEIKKDKRASLRCLDIFAGSGCVGVAVLKHVARSRVDFAEKYARWCRQIERTIAINDIVAGRWRVIQSDVFSRVKDRYDYIFANPPYIAESRANYLQSSVSHWEPRQALFAGDDGLALIEKFLLKAKDHLNSAGRIWMEFDSWQKPAIQRFLKQYGYSSHEFYKDQYRRWRLLVITISRSERQSSQSFPPTRRSLRSLLETP